MNRRYSALSSILLIEADDETRLLLAENLYYHGYHVVAALNESNALELVQGKSIDLILLNQVGRSIQDYLTLGQRIRRMGSLPDNTIIAVMAERYVADLEGKSVQVSKTEYVLYPENGEQLISLLRCLCPIRSQVQEKRA